MPFPLRGFRVLGTRWRAEARGTDPAAPHRPQSCVVSTLVCSGRRVQWSPPRVCSFTGLPSPAEPCLAPPVECPARSPALWLAPCFGVTVSSCGCAVPFCGIAAAVWGRPASGRGCAAAFSGCAPAFTPSAMVAEGVKGTALKLKVTAQEAKGTAQGQKGTAMRVKGAKIKKMGTLQRAVKAFRIVQSLLNELGQC